MVLQPLCLAAAVRARCRRGTSAPGRDGAAEAAALAVVDRRRHAAGLRRGGHVLAAARRLGAGPGLVPQALVADQQDRSGADPARALSQLGAGRSLSGSPTAQVARPPLGLSPRAL